MPTRLQAKASFLSSPRVVISVLSQDISNFYRLTRSMKPTQHVTAGLFACCAILLQSSAVRALELSGDWEFASTYLGDVAYARLSLKIDGQRLSGKLNELNLEGTIDGNQLVFTAKRPKGD